MDASDERLLSALAESNGRGLSAWRQLDPNLLAVDATGSEQPPEEGGDGNEDGGIDDEDGEGSDIGNAGTGSSAIQPPAAVGFRSRPFDVGNSSAFALMASAYPAGGDSLTASADLLATTSSGSPVGFLSGGGGRIQICFVPVQDGEDPGQAANRICLMAASDIIAREEGIRWTVLEEEADEEAPPEDALCLVTDAPIDALENPLWRLVPSGGRSNAEQDRKVGEDKGGSRRKVCFLRSGEAGGEEGKDEAGSPEHDGGEGAQLLFAAAFAFRGHSRGPRKSRHTRRGIDR